MKKITILIFAILIIGVSTLSVFAHSGRTDSYGGHNDNINGGYHYHCGGYPEHQHPNGECPYEYEYYESNSTTIFSLEDFTFDIEEFTFVEPEYPSIYVQPSQNYSTRQPSFIYDMPLGISYLIVVILAVICGAILFITKKK